MRGCSRCSIGLAPRGSAARRRSDSIVHKHFRANASYGSRLQNSLGRGLSIMAQIWLSRELRRNARDISIDGSPLRFALGQKREAR
ncbi:hypothetical protein B1812_08705 [Methylocystis bryophila]|uniref:Uncharacterized protein n=1 Tax=Methylocystis bryophila TaxID=655015 RepID=A0A1W6MU69_9HYPH|nr:hypothetical protein B1812_08705 [Methylocystis bryophila]